ncbi:IS110 family transposase [Lachnobacterium bovis]|uniref:Transposase n=1 Tax=Lachnobacterium bovis TaxID=140626 RepID=A0A1H9Q8W9_9FIRM|nr:IS110 family transposase [Lachnobacterium bovis]SER56838.1 Transposase [Lachnobacterium bovis]
MIYVGIDIAKDKHDCFIKKTNGEYIDTFTVSNNIEGFEILYTNILKFNTESEEIKVGLEATGHYGYNLIAYLLKHNIKVYVINPLHTNLYRKSMSLRLTKTDKIDSCTIVSMLMANLNLKAYTDLNFITDELRSLTRYRYEKVKDRAKFRSTVSKLICILFPELEKMVSTVHSPSIYALLLKYPDAEQISRAHLTKITNILLTKSKGHYEKNTAIQIREAARKSIGINMPVMSLELQHTIILLNEIEEQINEIEEKIKIIMDEIDSPITTIPGINYRMGAMILAEIGDFSRFSSPDKILAYAGMSPTIYQSGQIEQTSYAHMEKRGSKYLRYALFNATKYVCLWDPIFREYLAKKREEGKSYTVAVTHATKKLVRLIYSLEKNHEEYMEKIKKHNKL